MGFLSVVVVLALIATIGALGMGVMSMARGGDFDHQHSEQYMAARVGLQGVAVIFMFIALYVINF
jgi:hypothetical protein